jgi:TonB family protein
MNAAMKITATQSDWVGRVIDGRFKLLQWLGGTGHSSVFLTELPGAPSQKAAIKLIPHEGGIGQRIAFAIDASRTHAHLVRVLQSGRCEIDGARFIFMVTEYADEVLSEILPTRPLTPDEVKELLVPVLDTMSDLHENGLVHGSLRPSNILVVNDQLKLSADSVQPAGGTAVRTAEVSIYDAPERAAESVTPASDVWSLGVTIVEALTQKTPDWNRPANLDPHIPDSIPQPFSAIAAACLRVNRARRATVNDVRRQLGLAVPTVPPARPEPDVIAEPEPPGRSWSVALVIVAFLLAGVLAFILWHSRTQLPATPMESRQAQPATQKVPEPEQQPPADAAAPPLPPAPASALSQGGNGGVKGTVAQRMMPEISATASNSIRGTVNVRVRLNVSPSGDVTGANFESAGPSRYFADAAMNAARQWKFKPAQANGQPVPSVWTLQFTFTHDNVDVTPEQTAP